MNNQQYTFLEVLECNMCGSNSSYHKKLGNRLNKSQGYSPKNKLGVSVSIQKCNNCGLIFSNPLPVPFDIQNHYGTPPDKYWIPEYFEYEPGYFKSQIEQAKKLLSFKNGMKSLDIGAGIGKAMISMAKAGFDVYGLEPSKCFYEKAISEMGIKKERLILGSIEESKYEKEYFDFITFGAVFEHLYSPSACLAKALSWLKPNGIIHLEVPSSNWLLAKLINMFYSISGTDYVTNLSPMHPPYHLYEFDLQSFVELSKKRIIQSSNIFMMLDQFIIFRKCFIQF